MMAFTLQLPPSIRCSRRNEMDDQRYDVAADVDVLVITGAPL